MNEYIKRMYERAMFRILNEESTSEELILEGIFKTYAISLSKDKKYLTLGIPDKGLTISIDNWERNGNYIIDVFEEAIRKDLG